MPSILFYILNLSFIIQVPYNFKTNNSSSNSVQIKILYQSHIVINHLSEARKYFKIFKKLLQFNLHNTFTKYTMPDFMHEETHVITVTFPHHSLMSVRTEIQIYICLTSDLFFFHHVLKNPHFYHDSFKCLRIIQEC